MGKNKALEEAGFWLVLDLFSQFYEKSVWCGTLMMKNGGERMGRESTCK
jgi:hypothetical protein